MSIRISALETALVARLQEGGLDANGQKPERHISPGGMMPAGTASPTSPRASPT